MEEVLDTDQAEYDATRSLICMDEASRQLLSDVFDPLPLKPGRPKRVDDKYDRHGTCSCSTIRSAGGVPGQLHGLRLG